MLLVVLDYSPVISLSLADTLACTAINQLVKRLATFTSIYASSGQLGNKHIALVTAYLWVVVGLRQK